uniref:Uncharacterized protein n=1 Tax=Alexandrium monilatum TaxID=311494 RepID=A0A7S4QVF8_9DINO
MAQAPSYAILAAPRRRLGGSRPGGRGMEAPPPQLRRRILRTFRNLCYAARDLPDPESGRKEIWKIKAWLRAGPERWDARGFAYLRYQQKEVEAIIKLAKYRAMKNRYYS